MLPHLNIEVFIGITCFPVILEYYSLMIRKKREISIVNTTWQKITYRYCISILIRPVIQQYNKPADTRYYTTLDNRVGI